MNKRMLYGGIVAALAVNLFLGAQVYLRSAEGAARDEVYPNMALFTRALETIRREYVDGGKLTYQDLVHSALRGMLNALDPHSEFMEPRKYEDLKQDTEGAFGGVGIVISVKDNFITVVSPMEDTPGFRAGILAGDRIVRIDGKSAEKMTINDAVKRLRGVPGTEVTLTIQRASSSTLKEFKLTRAVIKVDTVRDVNGRREFPLSEGGIGYLRVVQFGERTAADLDAALKKLQSQEMQGLVLDLRGNPGGLLDQAVKVCEKFLPRGELIVSTEGRTPAHRTEYRAGGRDRYLKTPMAVLVNVGSASASEIVAGCLQDLKRAIVVGEQTFGKGSVQSILPMQDGSALRLTTAKYYTPSHKVIHERGITPDILVSLTDDEERSLALQRAPGGLESLSDEERERVRKVRDTQLDRAMDLLKGINLFTKGKPQDAPPPKPEKVAVKSE